MEDRRRPGRSAALAALSSLMLLAACGGERGAEPERVTTGAPAVTTTQADDEAGTHGDTGPTAGAREGRQLFVEAGCGGCHTLADAGTSGTVGPNLDDHFGEQGHEHGRREIVRQIRDGGGGMPAFRGRLTRAEMRSLADYILAVTSE